MDRRGEQGRGRGGRGFGRGNRGSGKGDRVFSRGRDDSSHSQQHHGELPRAQQLPGAWPSRDAGNQTRRGSSSQAPMRQEGDWICSGCGNNNFAKRYQCYRCNADRAGAGGSGSGQQFSRGANQGDGARARGRGKGEGGFHQGGKGRGGQRHQDFGSRGAEIDWNKFEQLQVSEGREDADKATSAKANTGYTTPPELASEDKSRWIAIPPRINQGNVVGTRGRKITIEVNHVPLVFDPKVKTAIHYDCSYDPDKLSKKVLRKIMDIVKMKCYPKRNPAFDGKKNLFSGETPLFKGNQLCETVELPPEHDGSRPLKVKVTIKIVDGHVDLTLIPKYLQNQVVEFPQKAVQVMDIVLRNAPAAAQFIPVGRSFFTPPRNPHTLGNGLELYYGFYQSVVLGWNITLNVDVANKGFPEAKVVADTMCEFKNKPRGAPSPTPDELNLNKHELENLLKFIKGVRVQYAVPGVPTTRRNYTVNGIRPPPSKSSFLWKKNENDKGRQVTVQQYYKEAYNYDLRYPHLPCLHVGNPNKNTYVAPELCKIIIGQVTMKKMDPDQTRAMIREAAKPPPDRKKRIMETLDNVNFNEDECVREFKITVGQEFLKVPARILSPPTIEYGNDKKAKVDKGEWRAQTFMKGVPLKKWAIASLSPQFVDAQDMWKIVEKFKEVGRNVGMCVNDPYRTDALVEQSRYSYTSDDVLNRAVLNAFRKYKEDGVQIVVVIITENQNAYEIVKTCGELEIGLVTQCLTDKTMRKMDGSISSNLLLKINSKLNGVNHTVMRNVQEKLKSDRVMDLLRGGTMLMGADVTHPSPDQKHIPSVAAVTASHDPLQFKYNMVWGLQPPRQEMIGDLHNIVVKHLQCYKEHTGSAPKRIIFYRDGVSEGEFLKVLTYEMTAIKWACNKELGHELDVTFLVVQKRHHTRFFPTAVDHMDRKGNVLPGTVVDTNITHPRDTDFYLVSHASLQGTSRPTKYHKLWDDSNIPEDDIEELTYFLCHMFSRCTRSVSYPAPTYYAHLAAARGRVYVGRAKIDIENLSQEMARFAVQADVVNQNPMFFV